MVSTFELKALWKIRKIRFKLAQGARDAERNAGLLAGVDPARAWYLRGRAAALEEAGDLLYDELVGLDDDEAGAVWESMVSAGVTDE